MRFLNNYSKFNESANQFLKTKDEIKDWLDELGIVKYTINDDLTVDVDGDVDLNNKKLEKIPVKFKSVGGYFNCGSNQLTSLDGSPESVGSFYCHINQLTSLEGCPESVGGHFNCNSNKLTSLKGCPKSVGGSFDCSINQLTSLKGCPESVRGYFNCGSNKLTSLKGCPESVRGYFNCIDNQLTSLEGCPKSVGGDFNCSINQLTSLEGCPKSVGGDFYCGINKLTSLEGCPKSVGGPFFYCDHNPIEEVYNLFGNKECIKWLNEYNVINSYSNKSTGVNKIDLEGFKDVIYIMDMEDTFDYKKLYQLKNYKVI